MKIGTLVQWKKKLRCCVTKSKTVKYQSRRLRNLYRPTEWNRGCALKSGIGKVAAALGATLLLEPASQM